MYLCIALINNREANNNGFLAQLVEQRTENPCVPGSIPGETTKSPQNGGLSCFINLVTKLNINLNGNESRSKIKSTQLRVLFRIHIIRIKTRNQIQYKNFSA